MKGLGMDRGDYLRGFIGVKGSERATRSKVLVVGAGGIGCEVLKNLVMCCVQNITVIDLDTIDVSNLNRQFLFRKEHVGMSKATVAAAAAAAMRFKPKVNITAVHGNIKDSKFNVDFFSQFDVVLSALDNVDARRHVNRMCLAAGVVEIESGSTGYLGQVVPIQKGVSECYECSTKPMQKVYPICTIRSTPDKPVHCIVWAKELYKLVFGNASDSMLAGGEPNVAVEATEKDIVEIAAPVLPESFNGVSDIEMMRLAVEIIHFYFIADLETKIASGMYSTSNIQPTPLDKSILETSGASNSISSDVADWDKRLWSAAECVGVMLESMLLGFRKNAASGVRSDFDKDDKVAMKFVTAASCLRAMTFSIQQSSYYDTKGIAGNIIPAISSTNAIIAGLQVTQAILILKEREVCIKDKVPMVFCQRNPNRLGVYLQPMQLDPPNLSCYVCNTSQLTLGIDTNVFTLHDFINEVVKTKLGFVEPSLHIGCSTIYEEGEDACDSHKKYINKKLCDCPAGGIRNGTILTVEDLRQELKVVVVVKHIDSADLDEDKYPSRFSLEGYVAPSGAELVGHIVQPTESEEKQMAELTDDEVVFIEDAAVGVVEVVDEIDQDAVDQPSAKRRRVDR